MNIELKVLAEAATQMRILLNKAYKEMPIEEYTKAYSAFADLRAEVDFIVSRINIEVTHE